MPGNNTDPGLDAIIERHGLSRDKAARQLRAWKAITFKNSLVKMVINPEEIEAAMYNGMDEGTVEQWMSRLLVDIIGKRDVNGSPDAANFMKAIHD